MSQSVRVHMLPQLIPCGALDGGVAVVIDVLRASTTIVQALANGAAAVVPYETVEQARQSAARLANDAVLLGGERGGARIEGFDLDNSPLAYTPNIVAGKIIVFTTTNGTRALRACETASRVLIGAFVNRAALVRVLSRDGRPVHLVCAGTDGRLTAEDILFAGAVASDLMRVRATASASDNPTIMAPGPLAETVPLCDVQTQMAIDYYHARSRDEATIRETIRISRGGQNLLRLRMDNDIERAAHGDLFDIVPEWQTTENRIVPASCPVI